MFKPTAFVRKCNPLRTRWLVFIALALALSRAEGLTLTGSFSPISQGSNVDLTAGGTLDWVHWGLLNETSVDRKATVPPQISNFSPLFNSNSSFASAYQYADNYNGYSWYDGAQTIGATNTTTGMYVLGSNHGNETNGFQITVPADTTMKTLQVFVGTFAAKGRFQATLSDSSISYVDASLDNLSNGPGGVYTIAFAAGSSNQTLTIKWTVSLTHASDGNVTLQAAALSANGVDNPPFAIVTSPANNATFTSPTNIPFNAYAIDPDGMVSKVEYFLGITKLGESADAANQFPLTWSNAAPGNYVLTARVTDNGGAFSMSSPISIFVNTSSGMLNGSVGFPPAMVDLTAEGTADWAHWGLISPDSFDHKIGTPQQISNFMEIGTNAVQTFGDDFTSYGWTNGTPNLSTNSSTGIFIYGLTNGLQLTAPADTSVRTLKVYVGAYSSVGNFQAYLSDFSGPAFADTSVSNFSGNAYAVYTLNYAAASPGQTLTVRYTSLTEYDQQFGNLTLQSATLQGQAPLALLNPAQAGNAFSFNFATQSGQAYTVQCTTSLSPPITWQTLTNFIGDGTMATVADANPSATGRFYRVQAQ